MTDYHLAQLNIARMRAPLDSPVMHGFVSRLDEINTLGEQSPGFVWILKDETGSATSFRVYDDPMLIVNLTVWESVEALREYAYKTVHVELFRGRREWFEKMDEAYLVLWWVPAGHIPTTEEARERMEYLRANGPSEYAFGISKPYAKPVG
jgi:hypothetical protein